MDLLSKPTDKIPVVLLVDGLFLLVLGLVIIVLHLWEKAEDQKENERNNALNYFWESFTLIWNNLIIY